MSPSPYLQDSDFTLYCGDSREVLSTLLAESVHMCVTSPPFFGLRDYGTGTWEGGDAECDHVGSVLRTAPPGTAKQASNAGSIAVASGDCKCGARRIDNQIGLESAPEEWVAQLVAVFEEVRRVLRKDGTLWVECGDSYGANVASGSPTTSTKDAPNSWTGGQATPITHPYKTKDLIGQPFLLAFALREAGWYWRNVLIWHKPNPMPESVRDRFTVSHSYVLLFSKSPRYFFDAEAVREPHTGLPPEHYGREFAESRNGGEMVRPAVTAATGSQREYHPAGRNARSVWTIPTEPLPFEHYAAFPQALAERCIKAGTSERGCCPECGAPWVREVRAQSLERHELPKGDPRYRPERYVGKYDKLHDGNNGMRYHQSETLGWRPSCDCFLSRLDAMPLHLPPCTILDPFLGSGTTALVSRRLGRRCIGVELNERYCELAAKRTQQLSLEAMPPTERAEASGS